MMTNEYPTFKELLINNIQKYNDVNIKFKKKFIKKLPYAIYLSKETEYEILFAMKRKIYLKDAII